MNDQILQKKPSKRKGWLLLGAIVLAIAAYTAGWLWASSKLVELVEVQKQNLAQQGRTLKCDGQSVRGYPFRIGLYCDTLVYADPINAVTFSGGNLRSAAQIYRPGHVIAELDGPADVTAPNLAPLTFDWENLRSSSRLTTTGFEQLSIEGKKIAVAANDGGQLTPLAGIEYAIVHARPAPDGEGNPTSALQLAAKVDGWDIEDWSDTPEGEIEAVDIVFNATLKDGLTVITSGRDLIDWLRENGGEAVVEQLTLSTRSGGRFALSGPLSISQSGRVSGEVTVSVSSPDKLIIYAGKVFPPIEAMLQDTMGLTGMAGEVENLKLTLVDGKVFAGFFPLGEIPPLFR